MAVVGAGRGLEFNLNIIVWAGLAAVAGHNWPLWFKFRGGGGLATSVGVSALLLPKELVIGIGVGLISAFLFKQLTKLLRIKISNFSSFSKKFDSVIPVGAALGLLSLAGSTWYFEESLPLRKLGLGLGILALIKATQWSAQD